MQSVSSSNVIGATVQQPALSSSGNLLRRVASALVLGPITLVAIYLGWPYFGIMMTVIAAVLAWEWTRICHRGELTHAGYLTITAVTAAMVAVALQEYVIAGWVILVGAMATAYLSRRSGEQEGIPVWSGLGVLYAGAPCGAIVWLRDLPGQGMEIVFWLCFVVWATDTAAYAAGRLIGGPKLAPSISPNKTWAGLLGGMAGAALIGVAGSLLIESTNMLYIALMSAFLAVVAQGGDLFESRLKRRFGVKDSSHLIAGHGGFLDRLDGLLAAALLVAALVWTKGGIL